MFEIKAFPESELEYWSIYFSIDDNQDDPIVNIEEKQKATTIEKSKKGFKDVWSR